MAHARSRRLSAERRHHPLQRAQRGLLGQARQGTLLAVPAGRNQAWETPVQAMYRELREEVGLLPSHVKILGRTRNWLRYEVPAQWLKRDWRGNYRGQKQIWFLLRLVGRECDVRLRASQRPEFDAWRWNDYWIPLDSVIDFKREVYQHALTELARYLFRGQGRKPLPAEIASR